MLSRGLLMVLFMLAVGVIGCQQRIQEQKQKSDLECGCPYEDAPYLLRCTKCGFEWCSSSPADDINDCPNCPLSIEDVQ